MTAQSEQTAVSDPALTTDEGNSAGVSGWWIAACLVLPVLWGVLVHEVFRRWRRTTDATSEQTDSVWPDYQI